MEKDYIRLFSADLDIKPTLLIEHFLKYMGFFVAKLSFEQYEVKTNAAYDIIVVGTDFFNSKVDLYDVGYRAERTIYIATEGYIINKPLGFSVNYDSMEEKQFLFELVNNLNLPLEYKCDDIEQIINSYVDNNIFEAYLFGCSSCIFKKLFYWAEKKYNKFIKEIPSNTSQLIQNIHIQLRYELNFVCKMLNFEYRYDCSELLDDCNELFKSAKNFVPYITKCEVLYKLKEKRIDAGEDYGWGVKTYSENKKYACILGFSTYSYEYEEYDKTIDVLKNELKINKKDYIVWYKLGLTYEKRGKYFESIECFSKIQDILKYKFQNKFLSPLEKQYLYHSFLWQAAIYKVYIGNNTQAIAYGDFAEQVHNDVNCMDNYINLMLNNESKEQGIDLVVKECVQETTKVKLKQIY